MSWPIEIRTQMFVFSQRNLRPGSNSSNIRCEDGSKSSSANQKPAMTEADQSEASTGSLERTGESDQRLNVITAGECPDFLCQITLVSLGIMYAAHAGCQLQASIKKAILFIHYPSPGPRP